MVLVDTNVLLDVATRDVVWLAWSAAQLRPLVNSGTAAINPVIYAELAARYTDEAELDSKLLRPKSIARLQLPYAAAFPAARAFKAYRLAGGVKTAPLPDFFIGAHAEAEGHAILTRDPRRYQTYFPKVQLITP